MEISGAYKNAIASLSKNHFCIRKKDFFDRTANDSFSCSEALFDLHDFAHLTTATLCTELYGNYYPTHLINLPQNFKKLIKSPEIKTDLAIPFADGTVFSQILTDMFNTLCFSHYSDEEIIHAIATLLAQYFLKKIACINSGTNKLVASNHEISLDELAVLTQNKAYELPASEIEQHLFTRGGINGIDELSKLKAAERLSFLAKCDKWLYFEKRNTIKHRAHKEAYHIPMALT